MRLDRLLHMVVLLANRKRVRAKDLADEFGVSVRTVYRDIDTICQAGIPIVSFPGMNGGLGIADGYRLDRNVFSVDELASVMVALDGVAGSIGDPHAAAVQDKIRAVMAGRPSERFRQRTESIRIDYNAWGSAPWLKERVEMLRDALENNRLVRFQYGSAKGELLGREAEPYTLVLKNGTWYLYAFCRSRGDFRLFKLARMGELELTGEGFERRELDPESAPWEGDRAAPAPHVPMVLRFPAELRLLAEDWFGIDAVEPEPGSDGRTVLARAAWPEDEWLYGYLLSFGDRMEIVEPARLRERIRDMALRIVMQYSGASSVQS
ncbi:helix-turn-helix transcriptional regulator [Gorillibacterium sp. sgz5001074]|uniref:helix-turn-helix transcriptional regulator n=1 Tax=Gorillibacterium sp. sgz5001074 TaxID=3446695 RepID=UPI003F675D19